MTTLLASSDAVRFARMLSTADGASALRELDRAFICDMDDTLNSNQSLFDDASVALADIYVQLDRDGRDPQTLRELHDEIDNANIAQMGYTPKRWHFSAQQAARLFAGRPLTDAEQAQVQAAADIAMGVGEILDGVEETLAAMAAADVAMVLKTKGCRDKQTEKLASHRFDRFFGSRIEIVDRKDPGTFRDIAARYELPSPVSVGDSERSDILPAIEAGFDAVLIDKTHRASAWSYEQGGGHDAPTVRSFPEAVCLIAGIA